MCGKLRSGLQLRVQPVGNVSHDLLPVELHQQLVARAGVELLLDVLYPGGFQAVDGALDAFALFAGMRFGKHKLAPHLSPKKTIEGSVGGFLGAALCCVLYGLVIGKVLGHAPVYWVLALYGLLGSLVSQLGDLSFSYIKRQYGIKDYGHLFREHGGVLDRFDSVLFITPAVYFIATYWPIAF